MRCINRVPAPLRQLFKLLPFFGNLSKKTAALFWAALCILVTGLFYLAAWIIAGHLENSYRGNTLQWASY